MKGKLVGGFGVLLFTGILLLGGGRMLEEKTAKGLPLLGEKFPTLEVTTTHGRLKLPDHFAGKWFVLFSHPADFTPVCTTEFVAFQKRYEKFRELNCELIGLSIDQVFSTSNGPGGSRKFLRWRFSFPLSLTTSARFRLLWA